MATMELLLGSGKMEDKEIEYKKRIKKIIENVEDKEKYKDNELYQELLEKLEVGKQIAINNTNAIYRNEKSLKGENSPVFYRQLLYKVEQVKITAILRTKKHERIEKAIVGFVHAIRKYYELIDDSNYPFNKYDLKTKIKELYKLIYNELLKPPNIPVRWALDDKRRILNNMKTVLGEENMSYFMKKYKAKRLIRLKFEDTKYFKYYAICWIIAFIILITLILVVI